MPVGEIQKSLTMIRQAQRQLMDANLRLVVSVTKRYEGSNLSLLHLVPEGSIGLTKAVDRFQYHRGSKFSTYAMWWIRQRITRAQNGPQARPWRWSRGPRDRAGL